ncbi:MAG TPA: hypothetical protein VGQ83_40590 [Polyangia bacterium]
MRRDRRAASLGAFVALAVSLEAAPAAAADLAGCRRAYEEQRYELAADLCADVAGDPAATRTAAATGWEVAGMAHLVLGHVPMARAAFCQALTVDPRHRPSDPIYPPRFVAVFEGVRQAGCIPPVRLDPEPLPRGGVLAGVRVRLIGGAPGGGRVVVWYRHPGEARWRHAAAPVQAGATSVELPGLNLRERELEYYVTLLGERARALARAGTPDHPRRVLLFGVTPGDGAGGVPGGAPPIWRRGWVWWVVGGVVLTTVVVSVAASRGGETPRGSLGTLPLP